MDEEANSSSEVTGRASVVADAGGAGAKHQSVPVEMLDVHGFGEVRFLDTQDVDPMVPAELSQHHSLGGVACGEYVERRDAEL